MRTRFGARFAGFPIVGHPRLLRAAATALNWLAGAVVLAQATGVTTGDLRGRVVDESGAPLPGVTVSAVNTETGLARSTSTGAEGDFVLRLLPPGDYGLTADHPGLQTLRVERVAVALGATSHLELTMRVVPVAEAVSVDAQTSPVDPTSTELASAITEGEIENLPINRRNYLDFALTTPGVTADRGPQTGAATTSGLSINGQDPRLNNVLLDGLDDNDATVGAVRAAVPQDGVREYQVIRVPYSAEYGRAGGGVVNVVTRSGSNDLARDRLPLLPRRSALRAERSCASGRPPTNSSSTAAPCPVRSSRTASSSSRRRSGWTRSTRTS